MKISSPKALINLMEFFLNITMAPSKLNMMVCNSKSFSMPFFYSVWVFSKFYLFALKMTKKFEVRSPPKAMT